MKIFNWVHRKLNGQQPSSVSDLHQHKGEVKLSHFKVQREEKLMAKSGDIDDVDTQALLGWREGLLAIGTLGLYTDNNPHPDDFIMNPNFSSFPAERNSVFDYPNEEYFDATMLIEQMLVEAEDDENPLLVYNNNHEINKEEENEEMISTDEPAGKTELEQVAADIRNKESGGVKAAGDRTTLADLFKAETTTVVSQKCAVGNKSVSILKENEEMCKQKKFPNSISGKLVKKLIPSHDANPVKKINHMMRKMMKRKIHPELRLRQKSATGIILENKVNDKIQANVEGMALL
ncbi:hypothetical protein QQ045_021819 [Rhodiola kirilowii]